MNPDRRDRLRDAAVEVLAEAGGRGLTHRAVDAAAGVPPGTAKNYFPTRDALLHGVAQRCVEEYRATGERLAAAGPPPSERAGLEALLAALLANVAGPGRSRLLAYLELQAEAARRPWLSEVLDPIGASDFPVFEAAQRAAGLAVTPERAAVVTLALHAAIPHLLAKGPDTLRAAGLEDPARFVRTLLDVVYPPDLSRP
ncbi:MULTISPECIES: TetR family transcriptional regulator [unclassified Streptomyces]|uniref:TetR/AcrR family transcriptional regulator n=1 Tax=unclassified Streptomyces TaxID=2593676 RepID=UPI002DDC512A|nr:MULTISPECIES: TetR family transcriptional regulator [unclassified Streptomyces]WSA92254.1 TetR family transcriptional regulator [Streptomyces sp. NBC_01795]WSB76620.1 TetR family transcriptional regulator [Streptomyces sp. NBC_01775]WSS15093.1 TetR family transcriptional regulator [Streptomyces sp. NBC_01186]WSS43936.1 TetR family transcriptional regulator [Streptomyces sp. NBC_01187]